MLRQSIRDTPTIADPDVSDLQPGAFGLVVAITDDQITVAIDDFDGGQQTFGPVPYTPVTGDLEPDDTVFLHFDHQGRPAYAAAFT